VVIGDKGLAQGQIEIKRRTEKNSRNVELKTATAELACNIKQELEQPLTVHPAAS
jgi:histidyl-tRNA synthetase